ncbi:MAG: tripartite tricarboxylate transporter substrate binding protein [Polynucleobacter sp.]
MKRFLAKVIIFSKTPLLFLYVSVMITFSLQGFAQSVYPNKPVTLVIPFPPGGGTDSIARMIQPKLAELLGVSVVIDNKPGASGVIATNAVAKAPPDGYTLFLSWDTHSINPIVIKNLPYDTFKDFVPITLLARLPLVMGASEKLGVKNIKDFIALAKTHPGTLNYASLGTGSSNRLHSENLNKLAGIKIIQIPYKGGAPSIQAILTGEVAYSFLSNATLKGQIKAGKVIPLAVTGDKRNAELPNVPTMIESGFPGFEAYAWIGVFAPNGTPDVIIKKLNTDFVKVLQDPAINKQLVDVGVESIGSSPKDLDLWVTKEYVKWVKFVQENNLRFDD